METLNKNPKAGIVTGEQLFVERISMILRKGNKELLEQVNGAMAELQKNGTLAKISQKYFKTDITCR